MLINRTFFFLWNFRVGASWVAVGFGVWGLVLELGLRVMVRVRIFHHCCVFNSNTFWKEGMGGSLTRAPLDFLDLFHWYVWLGYFYTSASLNLAFLLDLPLFEGMLAAVAFVLSAKAVGSDQVMELQDLILYAEFLARCMCKILDLLCLSICFRNLLPCYQAKVQLSD